MLKFQGLLGYVFEGPGFLGSPAASAERPCFIEGSTSGSKHPPSNTAIATKPS